MYELVSLVFMRRYNLKVKELKQLEIKALNNLAEVFSERVSNAKLIKLSNSKEYEHIRFLRELKELYTKVNEIKFRQQIQRRPAG